MKNKRILTFGLGLSLLFAQTAQAAYITPLSQGTAQEGVYGIQGAVTEFSQGGPGNEGESQNSTALQGEPGSAGTQTGAGQPGNTGIQTGTGQTGTGSLQTNTGLQTGTSGQPDVSLEAPGEPGNSGTQTGTGQNGNTGMNQPGTGGLQTGNSGQTGGMLLEPGYQNTEPGYQTAEPGNTGTQAGTGQAGNAGTNQPGTTGLVSMGTYSTTAQQAAGTSQNAAVTQIAEPVVAAEAAILYDATHDRVIYEKNADEKLYPASITKLMTALLVLENSSLDGTVTFSEGAVTNLESGAVTLNVAAGDQISVKDCLYGLLLKSANEVANGLAEHVSGSVEKFAELMNAKAKALGCTNTNFVNPNGLNNPNHYTTCRDMAKIAKAAFENQTLCEISSTMSYTFPATKKVSQTRTLTPGHKMLYPNDSRYYAGIVGGKTGYTSLAGNTLVTCVEKDGVRLIAVVMKASSSHYTDTKAVLDYGYALNAAGALVTGTGYHRWIQDGAVWHFELADGTRLKNGRYTIDGNDYVFDVSGNMLTGWQNLNGAWYYLEASGAMAVNGWRQDQDKWFYLGSDGAMVKNAVIDGQYYVGADGVWVQQS